MTISSSAVVARFPLVVKPAPAKASLDATHASALRLIDHIQVLEHTAPRAIHCLERTAEDLRRRAEAIAAVTRDQRARIARMADANVRARAFVADLRDALREAR